MVMQYVCPRLGLVASQAVEKASTCYTRFQRKVDPGTVTGRLLQVLRGGLFSSSTVIRRGYTKALVSKLIRGRWSGGKMWMA